MIYGNLAVEFDAVDKKFQANVDLLKRIQALHAPNEDTDYTPRCVECNDSYPCDTIQIIDGII